jgi:hypothetical protein
MPPPTQGQGWPPQYEAAAAFIQDSIVRESGGVPFSPERVHLDK